MLKNKIEFIYKSVFNFFVKKDGYSPLSHILASAITSMSLLLFLANLVIITSIIINIPLHSTLSKGAVWIMLLLLNLFSYIILFKIFKFSKIGDGENSLFILEQTVYLKSLKLVLYNLLTTFILGFLTIILLMLK